MSCVLQESAQELELSNINSLPSSLLHTVFSYLGPKDLCSVSATCTCWSRLTKDKASNSAWKKFYTSRWRVTGVAGEDVSWQSKYGSKMKQGKSWSGKYEHDSLYGHKAGIKSVKLLPSHGMLLSGSLDRTVRLWDLHYGMPVSISRPHGGTVRSVALDQCLVASGSSDNVIRLWHARGATAGASCLDPAVVSDCAALVQDGVHGLGLAEELMEMDGPADQEAPPAGHLSAAVLAGVADTSSIGTAPGGVPVAHGPYSVITGEADESLFDLSLPAHQLRGHIGPVTSLCLTDTCLYSGSWDYTVRCWRRGSWDCISVLKYQDWVWNVVARGGMLLVANGPEVHVHDLPTGKLLRKFQNLHEGNVSCLEGTYSGKLLFTGGADGLLMAHDLRMKDPSRVLWHHNAGVHGLALEDPWLVSAASDGTVVMHNLEAAVPDNVSTAAGSAAQGSSSSMARRSLSCPGHGGGPMYCVDIAESWLAAGGESPTIRLWDFTKAAEAAARAAAARAARNSAKRAKQRKVADAAKASKRGGNHAGSRGHADGSADTREAGAAAATAAKPTDCTGRDNSAAAVSGVDTGTCSSSGSCSRDKKTRGLLSVAAAAAKTAGSAGHSATLHGSVAGGPNRYHNMQLVTRQRQAATSSLSTVPLHAQPQGNQQHHTRKPRNGYCKTNHMHSSPSNVGGYSNSPQSHQQLWATGSSPQQHWQGNGVSPPGRWQPHNNKPKRYPVNSSQQQQHPVNSCEHSTAYLQQGSRAQTNTVRDAAARGIPVPRHSNVGSHVHRQLANGAGDSEESHDASASPDAGVANTSYRVPYSSSYPSATQTGPWLVTGSSPRYDAAATRGLCTGSGSAGASRSRLGSAGVDHQVDADGGPAIHQF